MLDLIYNFSQREYGLNNSILRLHLEFKDLIITRNEKVANTQQSMMSEQQFSRKNKV